MSQDVLYRARLIARGDYFVAEARQLACRHSSEHGFLAQEQAYEYWEVLNAADNAYRAAGLGLLAGRLAFLARRVAEFGDLENVRDAWRKFDQLNAGGRGVT